MIKPLGQTNPVWLLLLIFCAIRLSAAQPNSVSQHPGKTDDKTASLIEAEASFRDGNLVITIKTEEKTTQWLRIYLDTDSNGSTGFRYANRAEGADFIIEGNQLLLWGGGKKQTAWKWNAVPGALKFESVGEKQWSLFIPVSSLGVKESDKIRVIIESMSPNWGKTEDVLPREGPWEFEVSPGALTAS
jgi:hypothetical protein